MSLAQRRRLAAGLRQRVQADDWQVLCGMTPVLRTDYWFETGINGYLLDGGSSRADRLPGWYGHVTVRGTLTHAVTSTYMSRQHPESVRRVDEMAYLLYKANCLIEGWVCNASLAGVSAPLNMTRLYTPFLRLSGAY